MVGTGHHGGKSAGIARHLMPMSTRQRTASNITRWQYPSGRPPRPRSQPGSGSSGRIAAHSVSVKPDGYRRCRWGQSAALPYTSARQSHNEAAELDRPATDTEDCSTGAS